MTISPEQIARVRSSFAVIAPRTDEVAARFYERLFALEPCTRSLFKNDMQAQGVKLFQTLAALVDGLDMIEQIEPMARDLAIRHVRYGVEPHHYPAVGTALIETLRETLPAEFDRETEAAWTAAYDLVAGLMVAAATEPR